MFSSINRVRLPRCEVLEPRQMLIATAELAIDFDTTPRYLHDNFSNELYVVDDQVFFFEGNHDFAEFPTRPHLELWTIADGEPRMVFSEFERFSMRGCCIVNGFGAVGGKFVFTIGPEVWTSDGTTEGTQFLRQFIGLQPWDVLRLGDSLLFEAQSDTSGVAIWASDGTAEGTQTLIDPDDDSLLPIGSGSALWQRRPFTSGPDIAYTALGSELWRTDGTASGTYPLIDMARDDADVQFQITDSLLTGNELFFRVLVRGPVVANELWVTDGTVENTQLVDVGVQVGLPIILDPLRHRAEYTVLTEEGRELRWTDSSENPPPISRFLPSNEYSSRSVVLDNRLFAVENQRELWVTDGTNEGTRLIRQFDEGFNLSRLYAAGNQVVFNVSGTTWITDGTSEGTHSLEAAIGTVQNTRVEEDHLLLSTRTGLWRTNGTADGTIQLANSRPSEIVEPERDQLYFRLAEENGDSIWTTDGTLVGTREVFQRLESNAGSGALVHSLGGQLLIHNSFGLWIGDGTPEGTRLIESRDVYDIRTFGEYALYSVDAADRTDTWIIGETGVAREFVFSRRDRNSIEQLHTARAGNRLLAYTTTDPNSLYVADMITGEQSELTLEHPIHDGLTTGENFAHFVVNIEGRVFLWRSNGTTDGTHGIGRHQDWPSHLGPVNRQAIGDDLFFTVNNRGSETVWTSDGTLEGTRQIASLPSQSDFPLRTRTFEVGGRYVISGLAIVSEDGRVTPIPSDATKVGDHLVGQTSTTSGENLIWSTVDGENISYIPTGGRVSIVGGAGEHFYYAVRTDGIFGTAEATLWQSDGTPEGTRLLSQFGQNEVFRLPSSYPETLHVLDERLFFQGYDAAHGTELWSMSIEPTPRGDVNLDGVLDFSDYLELSRNFGRSADVVYADGDLNVDHTVDLADFLILSAAFAAR